MSALPYARNTSVIPSIFVINLPHKGKLTIANLAAPNEFFCSKYVKDKQRKLFHFVFLE